MINRPQDNLRVMTNRVTITYPCTRWATRSRHSSGCVICWHQNFRFLFLFYIHTSLHSKALAVSWTQREKCPASPKKVKNVYRSTHSALTTPIVEAPRNPGHIGRICVLISKRIFIGQNKIFLLSQNIANN